MQRQPGAHALHAAMRVSSQLACGHCPAQCVQVFSTAHKKSFLKWLDKLSPDGSAAGAGGASAAGGAGGAGGTDVCAAGRAQDTWQACPSTLALAPPSRCRKCIQGVSSD
jgi:hypothetical protein